MVLLASCLRARHVKNIVARFMRQARRKHDPVCIDYTLINTYDNSAKEQIRSVQAHFEFNVGRKITKLRCAVNLAITIVKVEPGALARSMILERD